MQLLRSALLLLAVLSATGSVGFGFGFGRTCSSQEICVPIERCDQKMSAIGATRCERALEEDICSGKDSEELMVCCATGGPPGGRLSGPCGRQPVPHRKNTNDGFPPFGAYPWMVAVRIEDTAFIRPGVLISPNVVLGFASSFDPNKPERTIVEYGTRNLSAATDCVRFGPQRHCFEKRTAAIKEVIPHPNATNVGVFKLDPPIHVDDRAALVEPACLPPPGEDPPPGRAGIFAGWKYDSARDDVLYTAVVRIVDQERCKERFSRVSHWTHQICVERVKKHLDPGWLYSLGVLLLASDGDPPLFTVAGVSFLASRNELHLFQSLTPYRAWLVETTAAP